MSGFFGYISNTNKKCEIYRKISDRYLTRHGSDRVGEYCGEKFYFSHKALFTTSESLHEKQPLVLENNSVVLVSDARIDNRNELLQLLNINTEKIITDTDLILEAYLKWGDSCINYLIGDFSFVLWDNKADKLFCARDKIGIRPLFYFNDKDTFFFSSEIEPLLHLPDYNYSLNTNSIKTFLRYSGKVNYGHTMFNEIYSLPPATTISVRSNRFLLQQYWYPEKIKIDTKISFIEASNKFKKLFQEAVNCRLRSIYPVDFELSGGLDSSSVVSIASMDPNVIKNSVAYSWRFKDYVCDEGLYSIAVAKKSKIKHINLEMTELDYQNKYSLSAITNLSPEWPSTAIYMQSLKVAQVMHSRNARVLLTGQGGDHLVAGNFYMLTDLFKSFQWIKLLKELKHYDINKDLIKEFFLIPLLSEKQKSFLKLLLHYFGFYKKKTPKKDDLQFDFSQIFKRNECTNTSQCFDAEIYKSPMHVGWVDNNPYQLLGFYNIEVRHPFFDTRLIEFVLSLPAEYKLHNHNFKYILKEAMKDILPEVVRNRNDKAEFSEILYQQIKALDLNFLFDNSQLVQDGYITQSEIDTYIEEFRNMTPSTFISGLPRLWQLINLENFYRNRVNYNENI